MAQRKARPQQKQQSATMNWRDMMNKTKQSRRHQPSLLTTILGVFALVIILSQSNKALAQTQWTSSNGTDVYNTNSGNVGIGTSSPNAKLSVATAEDSQPGYITAFDGRHFSVGTNTGAVAFSYSATYNTGYIFSLSPNVAWRDLAVIANTFSFNGPSSSPVFKILGNGNVGIGTTSPSAKLQISGGDSSLALFGPNATYGASLVMGAAAASQVAAAKAQVISSNGNLHIDSGTGQHIYLGYFTNSDTYINPNGGKVGIGTTSPQAALDVVGNINVSGNINAKYQDVAEWVPTTKMFPAGTVVVLDIAKSNQVTTSSKAYDTKVAGVISAQPGIALGEAGQNKVLVATTGRVKVKVDATRAPIHVGDLLVTGTMEGVAMKSEPLSLGGVEIHRPGTLIGKALEPLEKGTGEILVLLSLQ